MARSKALARFLSDFTLGFADGLTVPFALTAGLSSLGRTQTVIYAGIAELCAGSFSMGIGGYLSALDEARCANDSSSSDRPADEEERGILMGGNTWSTDRESDESSDDGTDEKDKYEDHLRVHLAPLDLPNELVSHIMRTIAQRQGTSAAAANVRSLRRDENDKDETLTSLPATSPIMAGLSISLGYVVGGLIPLLPYFVIPTIGTALWWSIALCLVALFMFGAGKNWLIGDEKTQLRRSVWEGLRMLVLGSLAAAAAVLCINLLEMAGGESGADGSG